MANRRNSPRSILITGGSSGIGEALARAYAAPGIALALIGRDPERLAAAAGRCREMGATVRTEILDVTESRRLADWIREIDALAPLDLVVANAGISAGTGRGGETQEQIRNLLKTNVEGVVNTVMPALEPMRARRRGQIAIMSSLAGFRGFPGAPAYCASKAAVRVWGEALRGDLHADGVRLSVICPGYIESRMTAGNRFPMPLLMESTRAARIIKRGLARNKARIAFPWPIYAVVWLMALLPPALTDRGLRRLPKKA